MSVPRVIDRQLPQQLFGIDLRSLAVFRCLIAVIILGDIWFFRWPNAEVFLSDAGAVSRESAEALVGPGYWSLYGFDGHLLNAQILLMVNAAAALGLLIGCRTRTMTIACLVLAWSVQSRNPLVLSGGDVVLRMFLWWSVFLPLGGLWSVDASFRHRKRPAQFVETSAASAAILLQLAFVYLFAGLAKCNSDWLGGQAIIEALQLEMYTKPFGSWLANANGLRWLLVVGNFVVLLVELAGPFLIFSPWATSRFRYTVMLILCAMHLGIWLSLSIGIFTLVMMTGWILFLPSTFWDRLLGQPDGFHLDLPKDYPVIKAIGNFICLVAISFCFLINLAHLANEKPGWYRNGGELFAKTFMLTQEFNLWAKPPEVNPRFSFPGKAVVVVDSLVVASPEATGFDADDSQTVDLFSLVFLDRKQKPKQEFDYYPSQSWRRFFWELRNRSPEHQRVREAFESFLVEKANEKNAANYQILEPTWNLD